MSNLPGAELWSEEHYSKIKKFINGEISEEQLIFDLNEDNSQHYFGISLLKNNYGQEYVKFIKKLSLKGRKIFLLEADNIGFTQVQLEHSTGYSQKMINNFKHSKLKEDTRDIYFLNMISLVCRVPLHWLIRETLLEIYDGAHLLQIKDADYSINRFENMLSRVTRKSRFVSGVLLSTDGFIYCLRIEVIYGALLIEILNDNRSDESDLFMDNLISKFNPKFGYMHTVISGRKHKAYFSQYKAVVSIPQPVEFYT